MYFVRAFLNGLVFLLAVFGLAKLAQSESISAANALLFMTVGANAIVDIFRALVDEAKK